MKRLIIIFLLFTVHYLFTTAVHAAETPKRIISLAPAITEMLFAFGLDDNIAGVTSFCDYPEAAKKKQKVGGMSNPSLEAVVLLKPDLVILTTDGNPKEFEERLRSLKIKTYVFRAKRIMEFPSAIRQLGFALGVKEKADLLAAETEKSLIKFKNQKEKTGSQKRKVLFIVWPGPLIVAGPGSIADDAMNILGVENIAKDTNVSYPKYSLEEIMRRSPDYIFIGKGHAEMEKVSGGLLKRLKKVTAVKNKKVFYVGDYLYRLTPRTMQGLEELTKYMGLDR